jgi:hypothetical protein
MMEGRAMRLGFVVPQFGPDVGPDALLEVARLASRRSAPHLLSNWY